MTLLASQPDLIAGAPDRIAQGTPALVRQRTEAWDNAQHLPPPSLQDEDWRRTDPRPYLARLNRPLAKSTYELPDGTHLPDGVHFSTLETSPVSHDTISLLDCPDPTNARYFTTLWKALHDTGTLLEIASGSVVDEPLRLNIHSTAPGAIHLPLVFIRVGANASVTLTLHEHFSHDNMLVLGGTVIVLEDGANLTFVQSTTAAPDVLLAGFHHVILGRDSSFEGTLLRSGGGSSKHYLDIDLAGSGSTGIITALDLMSGSVHRDLQTLQLHRAPSTTSSFLVRNVVDDHAHSVYSGLIDVTEEAMKTDGYVQNRNLLLSRTAQADSVPRLEIKANDVKCGHGTTAGHVDHEQLFYLESRGISRDVASRMIIQGFLLEGCAHMRSPVARTEAEAFVNRFAPDAIAPGAERSHG